MVLELTPPPDWHPSDPVGLERGWPGLGEVVEACEAAVPDATLDEMIAALLRVAQEHQAEADELRAFVQWRRERE